jgi:hypothetical protein
MQDKKKTSPATFVWPLRAVAVSVLVFTLLGSSLGAAGLSVTAQETLVRFSETSDSPDPQWTISDSGNAGRDLNIGLSSVIVRASEAAGEVWHSLEIPGAAIHGTLGEPGLPVISRMVVVPRGMTLEVEIVSATSNILAGLQILPVQDAATAEFSRLTAAYQRSAKPFASEPTIEVGRPAIMAGTTVVPVVIEVVNYDPVSAEAQIWSDVRLKLKTVVDANAPALSLSGERPLPLSFVKSMDGQVLGLDSADNAAGITESLGTYVAIHSGHPGIIEGIAPLTQWRREQGYHVIILDTSMGGGSANDIKNNLQDIYDDETIPPLEFITIFGDVTASYPVPAWSENLSGYGGHGDHYYTMLDGDDILADAHIGRVSFGTATEMNTVVAKILNYEKNPPMDDTDWYGRACLQGDPSASGITTIFVNQWVKGQLLYRGWSQVDTTWSGNFPARMFASVGAGVSAYGYRGYIGTSGITNGHVNNLGNGGKLAVALLPTCESGSFAYNTSRSEAWLRAPNGGAVAAVGTATSGTHTRYNNCYYLGAWDGILNKGDSRIGVAHTLGKVAIFSGYHLAEPNQAEIWAVWNNVMGDGATAIWTAVPSILDVSHPTQISEGAQAVTFQVQHEGLPVFGARVSLFREAGTQPEDFQLSGLTDENGQVVLDVPAQAAGSITITVTGANLLPYLSGMTAGPVDVFCGVSSHVTDGPVVPGATLNITPRLSNHGTSDAFAVEAEVSVMNGPATINGSSLVFGNIAAGAEVDATSALSLTLHDDARDGAPVQLLVTATDGMQVWTSILSETVTATDFHVADIDMGGFGGSIDPGDSGPLRMTLANDGNLDASGVWATLTTDSPWVNITDDAANFGNIASGGSGLNLVSPFQLSVSAECFGGHLATFTLSITCNGEQQAVVPFAMTIGNATTNQPTGPDIYGYYAIDNTDLVSDVVPVYDWVGIDPDHGGQGTDLGLSDFGWEQDDTKTIDLPFSFGFYGEEYLSISICSNGWAAMGETPLNFYRNFPLPASHSAGALIAPFWDNLNQSGSRRVYTWYDDVEHRFIIQWYYMLNHYSNLPQNFELILMDPLYHLTATGDGMILFQYDTVNNTDSRDGYATVGIQNMDRTDGLNYTYWNQYAAGAAPLASGRAVLFVPLFQNAVPSASVTPATMTQTLMPGNQVTEYLHISNLGENNSRLIFDLLVVDPLTMDSNKNLGGSTVSTNVTDFDPGSTIDLPLHVYCSSNDSELLVQMNLDLPEGVTVNSAEDLPTPQDPITWNGETGGGVVTTWGSVAGTHEAFLRDSESGDTSVNLTFDEALTEDVVIPWEVSGDTNGGEPHQITGEIVLTVIGPSITVNAPVAGEVAVLGSGLEVAFVANNGPVLVNIQLQREIDGPWQNLDFAVPVESSPWTWNVSGDPGPYARIRVSDSSDGSVFGLSGVFTVSRNLDWVQPGVLSGEVPAGQVLDVAVVLDATGLLAGQNYEANLVIESNGGAPLVVPVALTVTGVSAVSELPGMVTLLGNHPNPFNPSTIIRFSLPSQQNVDLRIYSARGRLVRSLLHGAQPAGLHHAVWRGRDDRGQGVASGVYFYRLETDEGSFTGKMVLTK